MTDDISAASRPGKHFSRAVSSTIGKFGTIGIISVGLAEFANRPTDDGVMGTFALHFPRGGLRWQRSLSAAQRKARHLSQEASTHRNATVHLLDNPVLRTQLAGLERRVVSGHEIIDHQQRASAHDDLSAACCGLLAEMAAHIPLIIRPEHVQNVRNRGPYRGGANFASQFPHLGERAAAQRARAMRRY